jgi:cytochrome oxidase Cu insertion factor (SCO1/SenC/PrrC family)
MKWRLAALAASGFLVGGLAALAFVPGLSEQLIPKQVSVGKALVGGPFTLTDHTGRRVTEKDFAGRHMLVLFGFTYCPDICPSGLQVMSAALDKLGKKAEQITPLFISLDPERDSPQQLAQYVPSFHKRLVGLTGTPEEVDKAAKAYRVFYKKVRDEKSTAAYTIDHTALIYLMGPDGSYVAHFPHALSPDTMAERIGKLL